MERKEYLKELSEEQMARLLEDQEAVRQSTIDPFFILYAGIVVRRGRHNSVLQTIMV